MKFNRKKLIRFVTTKKNASRYNERIVQIGNKNVVNSSNNVRGEETEEPQTEFVDNEIKTSKYSIYTFFFK